MFYNEFQLREAHDRLGDKYFSDWCEKEKVITNVAGVKYLESLGIC